jgi:hypothetical protein
VSWVLFCCCCALPWTPPLTSPFAASANPRPVCFGPSPSLGRSGEACLVICCFVLRARGRGTRRASSRSPSFSWGSRHVSDGFSIGGVPLLLSSRVVSPPALRFDDKDETYICSIRFDIGVDTRIDVPWRNRIAQTMWSLLVCQFRNVLVFLPLCWGRHRVYARAYPGLLLE